MAATAVAETTEEVGGAKRSTEKRGSGIGDRLEGKYHGVFIRSACQAPTDREVQLINAGDNEKDRDLETSSILSVHIPISGIPGEKCIKRLGMPRDGRSW